MRRTVGSGADAEHARDGMIMSKANGRGVEEEALREETVQGIVVADRKADVVVQGDSPRIAAFIWGGKVRPTPTLPYGRWKGAA